MNESIEIREMKGLYSIQKNENVFLLTIKTSILKAGTFFSFDKKENWLRVDDSKKCLLKNIQRIELNYKFDLDADEIFLDLILENKGRIRLAHSLSKNKLKEIGIELSKFLRIQLYDNHLLIQEEIYGSTSASDTDVDLLNNGC